MHELSLMADILRKIEDVARQQGASRVISVRVRLGALSHISADHFREHFEHACRGTVAEHASLIIELDTDPGRPWAQDVVLESVEIEQSS